MNRLLSLAAAGMVLLGAWAAAVPAVSTGDLYFHPQGYPVLVDRNRRRIFGELMTFSDLPRTLKRLDRLRFL